MTTYNDWSAKGAWDSDTKYLVWAYQSNYASITDPAIRHSLLKLGFIEKADVRYRYGSNGSFVPHAYVLTKKGNKRAQQILSMDAPKVKEGRDKWYRYARNVALSKRTTKWPKY